MENIFYDESTPANEYLIFRIPGGLPSQKEKNLKGRQNIAHEGPKCSLQEDLEPPSYMIAQEEILEELRDTMSQNIPSPRSRGAPIPKEEEVWRECKILLIKVRRT